MRAQTHLKDLQRYFRYRCEGIKGQAISPPLEEGRPRQRRGRGGQVRKTFKECSCRRASRVRIGTSRLSQTLTTPTALRAASPPQEEGKSPVL